LLALAFRGIVVERLDNLPPIHAKMRKLIKA